MNLKKIFIFILLVGTLASCSDNNIENVNKIPVNNPQVITEQKVEKTNLKNVGISEFKKQLAKNDGILIDLRTDGEVAEGVISGAKQIDFYASDFQTKLSALDKNKKYLIYCRSGGRSGKTLSLMKNLGFTNVYELRGGMNNWLKNGEKTTKLGETISSSKMNNEMMNDGTTKIGMNMKEKVITLNAKNWEFDKKVIRVKKGEKVKIKVNNLDGLHGIAIRDMQITGTKEINPDTSKIGEYEYICATYCGEGHNDMNGTLIIEG